MAPKADINNGLAFLGVGWLHAAIDCEKFQWLANWLLPPDS